MKNTYVYPYLSFLEVLQSCDRSRYKRTRNPKMLAPMIPLTFVVGYQADLAHGNKMDRIRGW